MTYLLPLSWRPGRPTRPRQPAREVQRFVDIVLVGSDGAEVWYELKSLIRPPSELSFRVVNVSARSGRTTYYRQFFRDRVAAHSGNDVRIVRPSTPVTVSGVRWMFQSFKAKRRVAQGAYEDVYGFTQADVEEAARLLFRPPPKSAQRMVLASLDLNDLHGYSAMVTANLPSIAPSDVKSQFFQLIKNVVFADVEDALLEVPGQ